MANECSRAFFHITPLPDGAYPRGFPHLPGIIPGANPQGNQGIPGRRTLLRPGGAAEFVTFVHSVSGQLQRGIGLHRKVVGA